MFWFKKLNNLNTQLSVSSDNKIIPSFSIPEPTKSLLWISNEDTSKIRSALSITLTISITEGEVNVNQEKNSNLVAEPSLIWTRLPIKENSGLEEKPLYWPAYSALTPEQRYQYLSWLRDVEQQTNLSYVFLYFYGLERHLLVGNYQAAAKEILRLLKYHAKDSFHAYAEESLSTVALYKNDKEFLLEYLPTFKEMTNELLLLRRLMGLKLEPREIMEMASQVQLQNRRFIRLYPDQFEKELEKLIVEFEYKNGSLLNFVSNESLEMIERPVLANSSLKEIKAKIPQLLRNEKFKGTLRSLLEQTHSNLKMKRKR